MAGRSPSHVWLCPLHAEEFWVPHGGRCPAPECDKELEMYVPQRAVLDALDLLGARDQSGRPVRDVLERALTEGL